MSYIRADEILPRELVEAIQQYVDGKLIYIPSREKQGWGSETSAKAFFRERNARIYRTHQNGAGIEELSRRFSLSEKSIQRILRDQRLVDTTDVDGAGCRSGQMTRESPHRLPEDRLFDEESR